MGNSKWTPQSKYSHLVTATGCSGSTLKSFILKVKIYKNLCNPAAHEGM